MIPLWIIFLEVFSAPDSSFNKDGRDWGWMRVEIGLV